MSLSHFSLNLSQPSLGITKKHSNFAHGVSRLKTLFSLILIVTELRIFAACKIKQSLWNFAVISKNNVNFITSLFHRLQISFL